MDRQHALNEAPERLYCVGPRIKLSPLLPAFAAHGPMAAEAMSTLGFNDDVPRWVEIYKAKRHHLEMPPPHKRIDVSDRLSWFEALGDPQRTADWFLLFAEQLTKNSWQNAISTWVPRLIEGYAGSLTHGLIRTGYAVRAFPISGNPSELQIAELARGLAFWASVYERVEGDPSAKDDMSLEDAIRVIPRSLSVKRVASIALDIASQRLLRTRAEHAIKVVHQEEFEAIVSAVHSIDNLDEAISRHSAAFCRFIMAHNDEFPIPIIHTVTAAVSMRNLIPYIAEDHWSRIYERLWQVSASIIAQFGGEARDDETAPQFTPSERSPQELALKAVEHGDEHAIKFTEACLREDAIRPDPIYRRVAESMLQRLTPIGEN